MMILYTMKYRSRTDIIVTMLEAATSGATKTKIMYSSYLSSYTLRVYLDLVISNGLLAYDSTKQRYSTTEKGLRLLELYNSIGKLELAPSTLIASQEERFNAISQSVMTEHSKTETGKELIDV